MSTGKGKKSLAGLSSISKKAVVNLPRKRPVVKASEKPEEPIEEPKKSGLVGAVQAVLVPDGSEDGLKEDYFDVEKDKPEADILPQVHTAPTSEDVQAALGALVAWMDDLYFLAVRGIPICSKKFEKSCLTSCQHFSYCRKRMAFKEIARRI